MPNSDSRSRADIHSRSRADVPWRNRAGSPFTTEKRPATGSRGMVVTNHPLASAAGAEMLAAGGNAVDAAVAALFALTIVEPMMVGLLGGGMMHLRLPDGAHTVLDGLSTVPAAGQDWLTGVNMSGRRRWRRWGGRMPSARNPSPPPAIFWPGARRCAASARCRWRR